MSHGAGGKMGTSTKLRMSESAQKSAVVAMRRVDQPPPAVVEWVSCELCMCVEVAMPASVSSIRTIPLALESHQVSRVFAGRGLRGARALLACVLCRGACARPRYRQWGISPRPETVGETIALVSALCQPQDARAAC